MFEKYYHIGFDTPPPKKKTKYKKEENKTLLNTLMDYNSWTT